MINDWTLDLNKRMQKKHQTEKNEISFLCCCCCCVFIYIYLFFGIVVGQSDGKDTLASSVVVVAPVATTEDEDEDDATINKWSKFRVKALKFNESTYFGYIVLAIIFIASIALVSLVGLCECYSYTDIFPTIFIYMYQTH